MEELSDDRHLEIYLSNELNRDIYFAINKNNKLTVFENLTFFNILYRVVDVIELYEWTWVKKWEYLKNYLAQLDPNYQKNIVFFTNNIANERLDVSNSDNETLLKLLNSLDYSKNTEFDKNIELPNVIANNLEKYFDGFFRVRGWLKSEDEIVKDFMKEHEGKIKEFINPDKVIDTNKKLLDIVSNYIKSFVIHDIELDGGYTYLWKNKKPLCETDSQPFIKILLNKSCEDEDIAISRENKTGNGNVDFTFTDGKFKICLEVKNAHHENVVSGIHRQLPLYMKGEKTKYGIYLVLWFKSENNFQLPNKYNSIKELQDEIEKNIPSGLNINLIIINCSKPISPSKNKNAIA